MTILPRSPGTPANGGAAGSQQSFHGTELQPRVPPGAPPTATPPAYAEFAAAFNAALRDCQRPDLLARSPLLRWGVGNLRGSAGPWELRALLTQTAGALFANPSDERLRGVLDRTYFHPALKQEAVAERLSLAFSTSRRYLTAARERLARWLWDSLGSAHDHDTDGEGASVSGGRDYATPRLSLVVLPLVNLAGRPDYERHVDGIAETLTTDLPRCPGLVVIPRTTAFAYKGKSIDARQVGRELGVRYVFEGSVQSAGDRMRINAQLVDAESGAHVWAERFDHPCTESFDMQDEVTSRLVRTIQVEMIAVESRRVAREDPDRLDSVDHTLRGWASWNEPLCLDGARRPPPFFPAGLLLAPSQGRAPTPPPTPPPYLHP